MKLVFFIIFIICCLIGGFFIRKGIDRLLDNLKEKEIKEE